MKRKITILISCLLLVAGMSACTGLSNRNPEMYQYYIQLAHQYDVAAAAEESQAEYYTNLAAAYKEAFAGLSEEQYQEILVLGTSHKENAANYREMAERYKTLAQQYQ